MLSTLVFSLIGMLALLRRKAAGEPLLAIPVESTLVGASLFVVTFASMLGASFVRDRTAHIAAAVFSLALYALFIFYHLRQGDEIMEQTPPKLRIAPSIANPSWSVVVLQLAVALAITILASRWFVASLSLASLRFGVSPLILALFLSPVATELPEAMSVVLWMRRREDHLAMSNILGTLMFQASIGCTIAILATQWQLGASTYAAGGAALLAVGALILSTFARRRVEPIVLAAAALLYVAYIVFLRRS